MSKKQFIKQIKSFEKLIEEHEGKIAREKVQSSPDFNLIRYWEKEVKVFINEISKAKKRLERGR